MTSTTVPEPLAVRTVGPDELDRNSENPRLIFRTDEMDELVASIEENGILVEPASVPEIEAKQIRCRGRSATYSYVDLRDTTGIVPSNYPNHVLCAEHSEYQC